MHCEGDKFYNQPGDCPVCNMHLIPLEEKDESQESHPAVSGLHDHKHQIIQEEKGTQYYCPMKCEGDKTYDEPGDCPVCNMHLIPVGEQPQKTNGIIITTNTINIKKQQERIVKKNITVQCVAKATKCMTNPAIVRYVACT